MPRGGAEGGGIPDGWLVHFGIVSVVGLHTNNQGGKTNIDRTNTRKPPPGAGRLPFISCTTGHVGKFRTFFTLWENASIGGQKYLNGRKKTGVLQYGLFGVLGVGTTLRVSKNIIRMGNR